jgi:hypothetical protein
MLERTATQLFAIAALTLATPLHALAAADACQGKTEGDGEGKGVVIGARAQVKVVVAELGAPGKPSKFTLENDVGAPAWDLTIARKGSNQVYQGPVRLHLCAREFHAKESCFNTVSYRPGVVELKTTSGFRVKLNVSCK